MVVVEEGNVLHHEKKDGKYIHLYSPERQQQQVKEAPNTQQQKTNKTEKNYAQSGIVRGGNFREIYPSGNVRIPQTQCN